MNHFDEKDTTEQLFSRTKQRQHQILSRQITALAVALTFGILAWLGGLRFVETGMLDAWFSRPQTNTGSGIVIVPISSQSLQQIGKWPWPPFRHAIIIELLQRWGARTVYIDHAFSEGVWKEDLKALQAVLKKKQMPVFAAADYVKRFEVAGPGLGALQTSEQEKMVWLKPVPEIAGDIKFGHRKLQPETDKVFRFWQPYFEGGGQNFPAAAIKMALDVGKINDFSLLKNVDLKPRLIPWNRGRFEAWPRVEFADLMQSYLAMREGMRPTVNPEIFQGRDVFIGLADETQTLSGLTPWEAAAFPVEIMAVIFEGLIHPDWTVRAMLPAWTGYLLLGLAAALFVLLTRVYSHKLFWLSCAFLFLGAAGAWGIALFLKYWLPAGQALAFLCIASAVIFVFDTVYARRERSTLFHLATRDGLTNLYVIRHFRIIMNQLTREASARQEALTVILLDIDHFKKINDTYGHPAGDMVLKKTAEVMQLAVRQKRAFKDIDFIARYGGEEFILLIRRNSLENTAQRIAERIRIAIQTTEYKWNDARIYVTASFGVSILHDGETIPDAMVHRADKALYLSKQKGRNQVRTEEDVRKEGY